LRSFHSRYSAIATQTIVSTMRTMFRTLSIRAVFAPPGLPPVALGDEAARHGAGAE
jgi:hypothetical protein